GILRPLPAAFAATSTPHPRTCAGGWEPCRNGCMEQDLVEVEGKRLFGAAGVGSKKPGGYFTASKPDDQFTISPELETEVKEITKQDQQKPTKSERPADYYN
ncbi:hypothetical protein M9458_002809, partial [Cirrhinus mrigala]